MPYSIYEAHSHPDPGFPIIFHLDTLTGNTESGYFHWHENIELIYCVEGCGTVVSDLLHIPISQGDIAVINANQLHSFYTDQFCRYYCLIADKSLFENLDFPLETDLKAKLQDALAARYFEDIVTEMKLCLPYYKTAVKTTVISLFLFLYRNYSDSSSPMQNRRQNNRIEMVKASLRYIRRHYTEALSIDSICKNIGFSKYYFCHAFRDITGRSVVSYINFLRCNRAHTLLASGEYTIGEAAEQSGFQNLSYFTKCYKKEIGELPSQSKTGL